jgi:hypothetical protein
MEMNIVARPTVLAQSKYNTRELVNSLARLQHEEAIDINVRGLKFVNFHSCVYKMCKSEGMKLHYRLTGDVCTMWVS